ncbi:nucleotide-binding alpha-beta plait domain-containing protein [Tanacetum coccineum]
MGSFRTKEDDVAKISTSVFITNFPESCSAKELFQSCKQYGHVVDTFIPTKRSRKWKEYMGELWVLLEFGSEDSMKLFQDNVSRLSFGRITPSNELRLSGRGELLDIDDQEEMCFHSKRLCIYTKTEKNIFEEFKIIIYLVRLSWISCQKKLQDWFPDFMEENDDEEQSDVDSKEGEFKVHDTGIYGGDSDVEEARETLFEKSGKKENNLDEEHKDKQEKNSRSI